ncbi:hypothetical protein [Streptomyces albidoflavus]|uniref:hypothetical protein n=1 Tax=Streptomyces albidoflavus TaxID=1886 RepID=UPI00340608C8
MRVRMKATLSGTRDGKDWPPKGSTVDLPADEAQHLLAAGLAAEDDEPAEEHAVPENEPETAVPARRKGGPRTARK